MSEDMKDCTFTLNREGFPELTDEEFDNRCIEAIKRALQETCQHDWGYSQATEAVCINCGLFKNL